MKTKLLKTVLATLALTLATPGSLALAQEIDSMYITPKFVYSYQHGQMTSATWTRPGGWENKVMGGEKKDNGYALGLSVGNDLSHYYDMPVRVELEYLYRDRAKWKNSPQTVEGLMSSQEFDVQAQSLLFNAFYDFNTQTNFTPYIGGGLGLAYLSTDYRTAITYAGTGSDYKTSQSDLNFAWNVGGGVVFHVSDTTALDFGYRYADLGTGTAGTVNIDSFSAKPEVDYTTHEFGVGLRFSGF